METRAKAQQYFSFRVGLGPGKVQFYENFHAIFLSGPGNEDIKYSPAWTFSGKSTWKIGENINFSLALSHITVTADKDAVRPPSWGGSYENNLNQGFIHLVPTLSLKGVNDRFCFNTGIRFGTASPFGDDARAKESSHSFGNTDIGLTNEFQFRINKKFLIGIEWVEGLTYYDYFETTDPGTDESYYSFFKYRSFQLTCEYEIKTK